MDENGYLNQKKNLFLLGMICHVLLDLLLDWIAESAQDETARERMDTVKLGNGVNQRCQCLPCFDRLRVFRNFPQFADDSDEQRECDDVDHSAHEF